MTDTSGFMKFIPTIFSNPTTNAIALTVVPGIFYVLAAYAHLFFSGLSLIGSIIVSVIFATIEYIIRVPVIKYSSEVAGMSNGFMQAVWMHASRFSVLSTVTGA